jgi:hypothetical protein
MLFDPDSKKKPYSSPTITKLTLEQAKQFLWEATDVLESLRREQDKPKPKTAASGETKELYLSRPQTWRDEVCFFFFLQVVRCHSCIHRHYRPLFLRPVPMWRETKVDNTATEE